MYLCDGFSTVVQIFEFGFAAEIITYLRARSVKLPAMNGGTPIDTHTMYNQRVITKAAQGLSEYEDMTMQCQYDVQAYVAIDSNVLNRNRFYKVWLPDGSQMHFWGCLYKFDPAELRKGEFPLAEVTVGLLNRLGGTGTEIKPEIFNGAGLGSDAWPPEPRPVGAAPRF